MHDPITFTATSVVVIEVELFDDEGVIPKLTEQFKIDLINDMALEYPFILSGFNDAVLTLLANSLSPSWREVSNAIAFESDNDDEAALPLLPLPTAILFKCLSMEIKCVLIKFCTFEGMLCGDGTILL